MVLDGEGANSINVFLIFEVFFKPLRMGPFVKVKNRKLSVTRSVISSVYSEYFECSLLT